jgi:pimeloyl-ACP methyl ester carboxylesterase
MRARTIAGLFVLVALGTATAELSGQPRPDTVMVQGGRVVVVRGGPATGPTVVFEAGLGEGASTWRDLQATVSASSPTLAYDRPGLGGSSATTRPRDAQTLARDLRAVLEASRVPKPYVLVGHSLGAWIVQAFARQYPDQVAGLVLVDPAYRESRLKAAVSESTWIERQRTVARYSTGISPAQQRERDALESIGDYAMRSFPRAGVPVVLLSGTKINASFPASAEERRVKLASHEEWLRRVPAARHVLVPDGRHYLHTETPALVLAAIDTVLARHAARSRVRKR